MVYESTVDVTDVTIFAPSMGGMIHVSQAGPRWSDEAVACIAVVM